MTAESRNRRLAEFFRNEYRKLLGFVKRRVDDIASQDAEDFVQDVVLRLIDRADISVPIEHLSAYVYRSLSNHIADYFRKRRIDIMTQISDPEMAYQTLHQVVADSGYAGASEIRQMEIADELYHLLEDLNDEEKEIIVATDIQGQTFAQLSNAWDIPSNTLISRKARALKKIQQHVHAQQASKEK
jgi:RNA polymerase sigma factor (sigma-70 family)